MLNTWTLKQQQVSAEMSIIIWDPDSQKSLNADYCQTRNKLMRANGIHQKTEKTKNKLIQIQAVQWNKKRIYIYNIYLELVASANNVEVT